ncbi:MAG: 3-phosphoglycerate dehydrogenase [Fimbriimonadaceae bacterium]|nr:3-phosphoglycerate dehydrogenase [Chitinophagales bacterium]
MSTILLATEKAFSKDAVERIKKVVENSSHRFQLLENYANKKDLLDAVKNADALIVRSDIADIEVFDAGKNLKIIVRAGAGYDNIDIKAATEKNICIMNTPGQNANAVAECCFGMMLYISRKHFDGSTGTELRGKKLGIIGYGNIGRFMAQISKGFGMDVSAYKRNPDPVAMRIDGVSPSGSFEEIFETCDYVSLHIPAVADTMGAINYSLLTRLPVGGTLINTARLEVVNEDDLIKIMEERNDIKYVSDFMPKKADIFKEKFTNRWFAPAKKMGAQTEEANVNAGIAAARQIINFFDKGDTTFKVN